MFQKLKPYIFRQKRDISLSALCSAVESLFSLLIPLAMAAIMDRGLTEADLPYTLKMGGLMTLMALIVVVAGVFSMKYATKAGLTMGTDLRSHAYQSLQTFTFRNVEHFGTASLITRLTTDISTIQTTAIQAIKNLVRTPSMLLFSIILSFVVSPRLALMFIAITPLVAIVIIGIIVKVQPLYVKMQKSIDRLNLVTQENLVAIRLVKAFVRQDQQSQRFETENQAVYEASDRAMGLSVLTSPAGNLVLYAATLALYWFGGKLILNGELTIGELTSLSAYLANILNRLLMLANLSVLISRSSVSVDRLMEITDTEPDIRDGSTDAVPEDGSITFENVSFRYDEGELLLKDLSLTIPSGQSVGILGSTGAAKTTLVSLIPRLYEICGGALYVGGHELRDYRLENLRSSVSIVLQQNTLFTGTITENLRWGNPAATQEELEAACRAACAHHFIAELPQGYDTLLGQGGVNLSGGQRQRLCIARAILKKPKILILDDSTSAVDMATDAAINRSFQTMLPGMTKLIIAQRISSVAHCDRILVLEDGRIIGDGTHELLRSSCPVYQELCQLQNYNGEAAIHA